MLRECPCASSRRWCAQGPLWSLSATSKASCLAAMLQALGKRLVNSTEHHKISSSACSRSFHFTVHQGQTITFSGNAAHTHQLAIMHALSLHALHKVLLFVQVRPKLRTAAKRHWLGRPAGPLCALSGLHMRLGNVSAIFSYFCFVLCCERGGINSFAFAHACMPADFMLCVN